MPGWYYDKKELRNTPSIVAGLDYKIEMRYRKEGARFIIDTGMKMDLGYNTTATGVVYFHRFYMFHSFQQFPRYVTACCCLFLAGKVEETPKKCKDIIRIARNMLADPKFSQFGTDPKEEVMTLERILLQTIKFDLQVEHPYQFLLKYAKCLKGDKNKLEKMVQMAWTFVNDSLCTTLCLQWEPEIIAVALMYLAGKLSKFEVVDWMGRNSKHLRWWDMFVEGVTMDLLEDICHQVLDLYSQPATKSPSQSPPQPVITKPPSPPNPASNRPSNGAEKTRISPEVITQPINTRVPPPTELPQYAYPSFTHAPPPIPSYPSVPFTTTHVNTPPPLPGPPPGPPPHGPPPHGPPPHLSAPPPNVFPPPYVTHPPPFTTVVPPPTGPPPPFYGNGGLPPPPPAQAHNPHRQYYPPT